MLPQLIALDMDGTLLDGNGDLPPGFAETSQRATELGVTLVPASGRQLATLQEMFPHEETFIAENGSVVVHNNELLSTTPLPSSAVHAAVRALDAVARLAQLRLGELDVVPHAEEHGWDLGVRHRGGGNGQGIGVGREGRDSGSDSKQLLH